MQRLSIAVADAVPAQPNSDVQYNWLNLLTPNFMAFLVLFILAAQMTDSIFGFPVDKLRNAFTPVAEAHFAVFGKKLGKGKSADPAEAASSVPGDLAWVPWEPAR